MIRINWYEGGSAQQKPLSLEIDGVELNVDEVTERALIYDEVATGYRWMLRLRCGNRIFRMMREFEDWKVTEEK